MNDAATIYRRFSIDDAEGCFDVFFAAVRKGAAEHYTAAQLKAWAPNDVMPSHWPQKLMSQACWVALTNDKIVGFFSLESDGCIDMAYVAPRYRRSGVSAALYDYIVSDAEKLQLERLFTNASHLAGPFFEKRGWEVTKPETVTRFGVDIQRFQMAKNLN